MRLIVMPSYSALSREAAQIVAGILRVKPGTVLALPTGDTPRGMYAELVRQHCQERLDFQHAVTFNLDELLGTEEDDPRSYRAYMSREFFSHVNVRPENIYIPVSDAGSGYEAAILAAGGIDLAIPGIGANGHIAFNEPGSDFHSRTRVVNLSPETLAGLQSQFPKESELPGRAITMGIGTILEARRVLLLASGQRKAEIVHRALCGPVTTAVPASVLQLHRDLTVILDRAAAALIQS